MSLVIYILSWLLLTLSATGLFTDGYHEWISNGGLVLSIPGIVVIIIGTLFIKRLTK